MAKETTDNEIITNDELSDGVETRVYELGFHLDPELPQEEVKKEYQAIKSRIEALGTLVAEGEPLKIPLAYTISRQETTGRRDFDSAYFCWIAYEADGPAHQEIGTMARENTRIVRYIDLKTTKEEAKHAAEMHEIFASAPQEVDASDSEEVEAAAPKEPEVY